MKQNHAVAERPCSLERGVHPDIRSFGQRPALPQNHGVDEDSEFVDQAVPHESGGQIGAAQGDMSPPGCAFSSAIYSGTTA